MTGNVLFGNEMNPKKGFDKAEELKKALAVKSPYIETEEKTEKEIRADKKARQRAEIQDRSWEEVKGSSRPADRFDSKQISRSGDGNGVVGSGQNPSVTRPTLFNPDPFSSAKNHEFTDHVIGAGKERRKAERERKESKREFEISKAKNTSEVPAFMMGFTPHRTALKPQDIPEIKEHKEISAQKDKIIESIKAGEKVAEIYRERDKKKHEEFLRDANDEQKWQDHAASKIERNYCKPMNSPEKPFNFGNPNEYRESSYKEDLSKIFKAPLSPDEVKEDDIKRKSSHLKDTTRKHRTDDRSWESVENSKSKKF